MLDAIFTIILLIAILGLLVFVHELGHFLAAKSIGVEVEEFAFGFGPSIWAYKYKDTIYKINWLPLGGYVKILGDQDPSSFQRVDKKKFSKDDIAIYESLLRSINASNGSIISRIEKINHSKLEKEDRLKLLDFVYKYQLTNSNSYFDNKSAYQQFFVFVAGVVMNFFVAVIFFNIFLFMTNQKTEIAYIADYNFIGTQEEVHYKPVLEHFYNKDLEKKFFRNGEVSPIQLLAINNSIIRDQEQLASIWESIENEEVKVKYFVFGEGKILEKNVILNSDGIDTNIDPEIQNRVIFLEINEDSPANKGGLEKNDIILSINSEELELVDKDLFLEILQHNAGLDTSFMILKEDGSIVEKTVLLNEKSGDVPLLGAKYNVYKAFYPGYYHLDYSGKGLLQGVYHAINITGYNPVALAKIIKISIDTKDAELASQTVSSVWGVGEQYLSRMVVSRDYLNIINTVAIISVALAFMNILPIPLLDGGQIMFMFVEKIKGSPIRPSVKEKIAQTSFYILVGFSILIILKDIWLGVIGKFIRQVV